MSDKLQTNLSGLVTKSTAAGALGALALVIPTSSNPSATKGYQPRVAQDDQDSFFGFLSTPSPLLFHYEGENSATMESDITDHYVEDNTTVVDQIGLRPEQVTVSGFIGELNNILPLPLQILQTMANTLLTVDVYQPALGATALIKLNQATLLYESARSIANNAVNAWATLAGSGSEVVAGSGVFTSGDSIVQSEQQIMFQQFYAYWSQRTLFDVQTPWAIFTNMAIKSLKPTQDADTRMITNFEITFKKIRTASTQTTTLAALSQARAATQASLISSNGSTPGVPGASLGASLGAIV